MRNRPIGIFDSGVGGLTVLKEIERLLPKEDIIYLGDTARVPYGNKSKSAVIKFSTQNLLFLLEKKVKIVVVACNTSSAIALDYLKETFNVSIVGVIEAGVNKALEVSQTRKIGVIGTKSTIESKSYEREILKRERGAKVYSQSCPLFVPLVEEGILRGKIVDEAIKRYMGGLKKKGIDTIILGCTHYPLLKREISCYLRGVTIIDSASEVALHTKELLGQLCFLNQTNKKGKKKFYLTDEPKGFIKLAELFLKRKIPKPKVVNV